MNLSRKIRYWLMPLNYWLWKKMSRFHAQLNLTLYQDGNGHSLPKTEQFTISDVGDVGPMAHRIQQIVLQNYLAGRKTPIIVEIRIRRG